MKAAVAKQFVMLPLKIRDARRRLAQMRRLQSALVDSSGAVAKHASQLRLEVSLRWTSGSLGK